MSEVEEVESYLVTMGTRIDKLEQSLSLLEESITKLEISIFGKKRFFKKSLAEIRQDMDELKTQISFSQGVIVELVVIFKKLLKKEDYLRFERRLDAWAPENFVSRLEAERILDDAFQ